VENFAVKTSLAEDKLWMKELLRQQTIVWTVLDLKKGFYEKNNFGKKRLWWINLR